MTVKHEASIVCVLLLAGASAAAGAEELDVERSTENPTLKAAGYGAFSALTMPARVGGTAAFAWGLGGYDSSRKGPLVDTTVEVRLWGPIALRGGATYSNDTSRMRPHVGARAQLLRQEAHGVDGSLAVFYKAEGFTEGEGEIETFASFGRTFEHVTLIGNLVYGQDPEGNERDGEVRATAFHQRGRFSFGLDGRTRFAIGAQHGKAATVEPKFDVMGGPLGSVTLGPIAVFAEAGPSAFSLGGTTRAGVAAFGGIGSAF
jgi:hypothetical protein